MYKMKRNRCYYGNPRGIRFTLLAEVGDEDASIPLEISSIDDIDLDAITRELATTVYKRSRKNWDFEVRETTPEQAAEWNEELMADPKLCHLPKFKPTIHVSGNGVSLTWEYAS